MARHTQRLQKLSKKSYTASLSLLRMQNAQALARHLQARAVWGCSYLDLGCKLKSALIELRIN
jgi:hypothetical protein